jgi:hypothetical protein
MYSNMFFTPIASAPLQPYFAFGSNMSMAQMQARLAKLGHIAEPIIVHAKGAKLVFDKLSKVAYAGCGVGNILLNQDMNSMVQKAGIEPMTIKGREDLVSKESRVEGLLYYLNQAQIRELDHCEGVVSRSSGKYVNNQNGYKRCKLKVQAIDGNAYEAIAYIANAAYGMMAENDSEVMPKKPQFRYVTKFLENEHLSLDYRIFLSQTEVLEGGVVADHYISPELLMAHNFY